MGKKGEMQIFDTIDDYIKHQPIVAQRILIELRNIVKEVVPEVVELPNKKVATFKLVPESKSNLQIMVAAYVRFVSFYPFASAIERFAEELTNFKIGKGCINFPFDTEIPRELIIRIIEFRKNELIMEMKNKI